MESEYFHLDTDFEAAAALLDEPSKPASFVLNANLFHQREAAKQGIKASRKGIKALIRPENALPLLQQLPEPGGRLHAILRGDFVLCDLIPAIINARGHCNTLHIATLGLSAANAVTLAGLHDEKKVDAITVLCSHYFQQVDKATTYREVVTILQGRATLKVARTHAKVICIATTAGDAFVIEGSANLRSSDNLEQIVVFNDSELLAFHLNWINLLSTHA